MAEEKKQPNNSDKRPKPFGGKPFGGNFQGRKRRPFRKMSREADEFQQKMVDLARVTRVMAGGKRMKFRACVVIGDAKDRVGFAVAKGTDVAGAISKAVTKAKKNLITVPIIDGTIPHEVGIKFKAAQVLIKPAKPGSGIKAGGVVRVVLELAGIKDASAKILGSNNKVNNVSATFQALKSFKVKAQVKKVAQPVSDDKKEAKDSKSDDKTKSL